MAIQPTIELSQAIRAYKSGDRKAFSAIYRLSRPYLAKCAANVVNRVAPNAPRDLLEDVLQDTYMTIAEKLDTLQNEDAYFQWVGQIVTNHALRACKKDSVWWDMEQVDDIGDYEDAGEQFIPEDILQNREKQLLIRNMLQQLPSGQYMCLVEYFYNGLKEREIADKLEMPLGTVKTNLSRAKKKLKEIVQTHEKKNGVKLYSMSWLLLVLFWDDIKAMFPAAVKAGSLVVEEAPVLYAAGTGAAGGASGAAGGASGAAGGASAAAGGASAAGAAGGIAAMGIGTKIVAGVVAAALAVGLGGTAALVIPEKKGDKSAQEMQQEAQMEQDGENRYPEDDELLIYDMELLMEVPVLSAGQIAAIEATLGSLKAGDASVGDIIPEDYDADAGAPMGILYNAEYMGNDILIITGTNTEDMLLAVTVERVTDGWEIQSVEKANPRKQLYPILPAMREKGVPAVMENWRMTDESGMTAECAHAFSVVYWRERLGNTSFCVPAGGFVAEDEGWHVQHLAGPDYYEPETDVNEYIMWDAIWINRITLEIRHTNDLVWVGAPDEVVQALLDAPDSTAPETEAPEAAEPTAPEETEPEVLLSEVMLSEEEMERLERVLLYTAFVDSDVPSRQSAASLGLMAYAPGEYDYLQKTIPVESDWDKLDVLLLMAWNQEEILDVQYESGNDYGGVSGTYSYSAGVAETLLTRMYGPVDLYEVTPNIYVKGYSTAIENGRIYQAAEHAYREDYGDLTVEHITDLRDGMLHIYAIYRRNNDTVYCVYDAVKNPDSYIGCTLTDVTYTLDQW